MRFADVDPKTGTGLELQAIAAAVVGGVAISGGRGNLWGVLAGVLLLSSAASAKVLLVGKYHGNKGKYQSIQAAVNGANSGDWILVGPGDYSFRTARW